MMMTMTMTMMIFSRNSDFWQWRHFSQSSVGGESNISYYTTSLSPCYCDVWYAKTSVSNWQRYCFTNGKKHCKKLPLL